MTSQVNNSVLNNLNSFFDPIHDSASTVASRVTNVCREVIGASTRFANGSFKATDSSRWVTPQSLAILVCALTILSLLWAYKCKLFQRVVPQAPKGGGLEDKLVMNFEELIDPVSYEILDDPVIPLCLGEKNHGTTMSKSTFDAIMVGEKKDPFLRAEMTGRFISVVPLKNFLSKLTDKEREEIEKKGDELRRKAQEKKKLTA